MHILDVMASTLTEILILGGKWHRRLSALRLGAFSLLVKELIGHLGTQLWCVQADAAAPCQRHEQAHQHPHGPSKSDLVTALGELRLRIWRNEVLSFC